MPRLPRLSLSALALPLLGLATACGSAMPEPAGDDTAAPDAQPPPPPPQPDAPPSPTCTVGLDDVITAHVVVDTDDAYKLWVNGVLIDDLPRSWNTPGVYDVAILRHPSRRNVIAIEGRNEFNIDGRDRGLIADVRFTVNGVEQRVATDASWKINVTSQPGWETQTFSDAQWPAPVVIGPAGIDPWYSVLDADAPGSTASWLWTYDPTPLAASEKLDLDYAYARTSFSVVDPACD